MSWTVTMEDEVKVGGATVPEKIHVRAIIRVDEQAELKDLIASLQKHVKEDTAKNKPDDWEPWPNSYNPNNTTQMR